MSLSAQLFCDHCGAANREQAQFCRACGRSLRLATDSTLSSTLTGFLNTQSLLKQQYLIMSQAGRGGFGAVYKASDLKFGNRLVAVKEMSQSSLNPKELEEALASFNREALLLAGLTHPNLPRIYDQFMENGRSYLVMDFIDGETLEDRLKRLGGAKLPVEKILDIALQLCSVLDYLHTRKPPIIFRDLKPANIMIISTGHVYLIDFGIARNFTPGQEKDTTALGSYGYAPPEQYGKSQTTERADIYSLGATLHQLLTGEDPSETPFQFSQIHLRDERLRDLETLVMSMVNVDITKRPASVTQVRQELQQVTMQYTMGQTLPRLGVNGNSPSFTSATLAPLPPKSVAATASYPPAGYQATPKAPKTPPGKRSKRTGPPQIYPQANMLYVCMGHATRITALSWSPNGKYLASASYDKTVQIWDATNGNHLFTYKGHSGRINDVCWSPDSQLIVSASDDKTVRLWLPLTGRTEYIFDQHTAPVNALSWSPDGQWLASGGDDKQVLVWQATKADHTVSAAYREHTAPVLTVSWSPDSRVVTSGGNDHVVRIWDPVKIQQKRSFFTALFSISNGQKMLNGYSGNILDLAWSPDNRYLAATSSDHQVRLINIQSNYFSTALNIDNATLKNTLSWSPSGQHLAIAGNDKLVHLWNVAQKKETYIYHGHTGYIMSLAWSPDGSKVASAGVDRTIQVWQAQ
ncbi:serine/threonine protein kinase [Dictyobacter alpinus]|uniref:Serine/threonine protein kinase n=1 Tax=Dictyobacter alpinus TaxID=2014873 RepID=A0A402B401_9CHLR|nr:serine/threonine-protein kinase [Dictyobacter alpinus]GCE26079.1 serine/threonine protein kinase [Dictyobacter alpinus]